MNYRGTVRNGVVEFEEGPVPADGTSVVVEPVEAERPTGGEKSLPEALLELAGIIDDLPADFARNHDHYIHGQPKR